MARPLPPPLLMARPLVEELFFCGFPKESSKKSIWEVFKNSYPVGKLQPVHVALFKALRWQDSQSESLPTLSTISFGAYQTKG